MREGPALSQVKFYNRFYLEEEVRLRREAEIQRRIKEACSSSKLNAKQVEFLANRNQALLTRLICQANTDGKLSFSQVGFVLAGIGYIQSIPEVSRSQFSTSILQTRQTLHRQVFQFLRDRNNLVDAERIYTLLRILDDPNLRTYEQRASMLNEQFGDAGKNLIAAFKESKLKKLSKIKQKQELATQYSFSPAICQRSKQLAKDYRPKLLYKPSQTKQKIQLKRKEKEQKQRKYIEEHCTFKPSISPSKRYEGPSVRQHPCIRKEKKQQQRHSVTPIKSPFKSRPKPQFKNLPIPSGFQKAIQRSHLVYKARREALQELESKCIGLNYHKKRKQKVSPFKVAFKGANAIKDKDKQKQKVSQRPHSSYYYQSEQQSLQRTPGSQDSIICELKIKIDEQRTGVLRVLSSSDPAHLAWSFCHNYKLPESQCQVIERLVGQLMQESVSIE